MLCHSNTYSAFMLQRHWNVLSNYLIIRKWCLTALENGLPAVKKELCLVPLLVTISFWEDLQYFSQLIGWNDTLLVKHAGVIRLSEGNWLINDAGWKLYQNDAPDAWLDGEVSLLLFKASSFYTVWEKIEWKQLEKLLRNGGTSLSFSRKWSSLF